MELDLFNLIESPAIAAQFDLYSDIRSLYRWIKDHLYTRSLQALAETDPTVASALAERAIGLFDAPAQEGYRTDHEPAICFYAVILCRTEHPDARHVIDEMDANSTRVYGWLDLILGCALRDASTTTWSVLTGAHPDASMLGMGASTSFAEAPYSMSTSFEQVTEGLPGEGISIEMSRQPEYASS